MEKARSAALRDVRSKPAVYFGGKNVDAVTCVLAAQELAARYDWFTPSVRDIRMLRIEENNDLMPAVARGGNAAKKSLNLGASSELRLAA